jgi:hypothetical protein
MPQLQALAKLLRRYRERFRTEALESFRIPLHPPKLADIIEQKNSAIECKTRASIWGFGAIEKQLSRHAEMNRQYAVFETHQNVLAVALESENATPFDFGLGGSAKDTTRKEFCAQDGSPGKTRDKQSDNGFDFREFGHVEALWKIGQDIIALDYYGELSQLNRSVAIV